jgi:AcrR family transcriptional regulator
LTVRSSIVMMRDMARNKEFDVEAALDAAIGVFRLHGYAGTSASMLIIAMGIGRQSMYDTFGDKWQLYCAAVRRYSELECAAHFTALNRGPRAIDGIRTMIERIVIEARQPCLGVGSLSEFGNANPELVSLREGIGNRLRKAISNKIQDAQVQGDIAPQLDAGHAAGFLIANIAGIRLSARGGVGDAELRALGHLAISALR